MATTREHTEAIARQIEVELSRLGVLTTHRQPCLLDVYVDDDAPAGWVRISDGTGVACGAAEEVLAVLKDVTGNEKTDHEGNPSEWESVWDALGEFAGRYPVSSEN